MQCKSDNRLALPIAAAMAGVVNWWRCAADSSTIVAAVLRAILGLRVGEPALRITMALRLRRRLVGRLLHQHLANPPPCVAKHILDFVMNDLGKLSVSMRWACILLRSGVQWEW